MNKFYTAWIDVRSNEPFKLYLPTKKNLNNKIVTFPSSIGHYNNVYPAVITNKIKNTSNLFPIRLIKTNNQYKVGPLVGILTTDCSKGFNGNPKNYKEIITTGIKYGTFIYVFTPASLNTIERTINAFIYLPQKKRWIRRIMPFPDVVYNRVPYRKNEEDVNVIKTINYLKQENIPFFNPFFFDKWTLAKWMEESEEFKKIIPKTALLSKVNLYNFIRRNTFYYLKPIQGKAGLGFYKIITGPQSYTLIYQSEKGISQKEFYSISDLWNHLAKQIKNKKYIIQSGIDLETYNGSPYDVRILVQKNGNGEWKTSGIGIRIAGRKSITTHVPRGGYIESVDKVFKNSFGVMNFEIWKKYLEELAIRIAKYIEIRSSYTLGEMSLDLGIDKNHNIWFFEANSKPMEFDEPNIRSISLIRLIQYFKYLANFP